MYRWNKKGLEIVLSTWWFLVIFMIGGGIVISAGTYYSENLDIKFLEADILGDRILDCIADNGYLIEGVFEEGFYFNCGLDKSKFGEGSNYFFKVWVDGELKVGGGDYSIESNCRIRKKGVEATEYFPRCSEKEIVVLDEIGGLVVVKVLTASNQQGRTEFVV